MFQMHHNSKMFLIWIFFMVPQLAKADFFSNCTTDENCACYHFTQTDDFEYQCPYSPDGISKTLIHVYRSNEKIDITCHHDVLDETVTPSANFTSIKALYLMQCPAPKGGFKTLTDRFNVENLKFLRFEKTQAGIIDDESLKGLESLKELELPNNGIKFLNSSFFKNVPNLTDLTLDWNEIKMVDNVFQNIQQLRYMSIASNKLENIPKYTFKGLVNLKRLSLWSNKLNHFEDGTFDDLKSLEFLELSLNKLSRITENTFMELRNLKELYLRRNRLSYFSRNILENSAQLKLISLCENRIENLAEWTFSNFTAIKMIFLTGNSLTEIPEMVFHGSIDLNEIRLDFNKLKTLPKNIFRDLVNLKKLHLNNNEIMRLYPETFMSLENLLELRLDGNNLTTLHRDLLKKLKKLERIDLSYNKIYTIDQETFMRNTQLKIFSMSNNVFDFEGASTEVATFLSIPCKNLESVDLSYNKITKYPYDLSRNTFMNTIALDHNEIKSIEVDQIVHFNPNGLDVFLNDNNITYISLDSEKGIIRPKLTLEISNNPLMCDCHALNLVKYLQNNIDDDIAFISKHDKPKCSGPEQLKDIILEEVLLQNLTCSLIESCTRGDVCDCKYRPDDMTMVVNCSRRNLIELPELLTTEDSIGYNFVETEVHLEDNELSIFSDQHNGFNQTTKLFLAGNRIENITSLPKGLKLLDLRYNNLSYLDDSFLKILNESRIETLNLSGNPWNCGCGMETFSKYLRDNTKKIQDINNVKCNATGRQLMGLNEKDLCPAGTDITRIILLVICFCLFIITALVSLYFMHQKEILVWLYGRGLCLWLVEEEKLDKDKIFDAFVSYSSKDADFVENNLISVLEQGETPYKLCVHVRDWIGGELIHTQIINSVKDSKRTVVILSSNFLNSDWGKMEFRTAHAESLQEKRARVIIVIYGEIDIDSIDEELQTYLKTNTYIKWGDPWFWDKLRYALPRTKRRKKNSQKHENMMRYIEDKFKLDKEKSISASTIKPPIILNDEEHRPMTCIA